MLNAEGQDQYILNIATGEVKNLTNSPKIWDEHGVFSPSGQKILFMSSYPYRDDTTAYRTLSLKTEFMIMDIDGSNLEQLTHFRTPGFPEYHEGIASTGYWNDAGTIIYAHSLEFPDYHFWEIELQLHLPDYPIAIHSFSNLLIKSSWSRSEQNMSNFL